MYVFALYLFVQQSHKLVQGRTLAHFTCAAVFQMCQSSSESHNHYDLAVAQSR